MGCCTRARRSQRVDYLQSLLEQRFPKMQTDPMKVQGPQACADVRIYFVLHGLCLNLLPAVRARSTRSGVDIHPNDPRPIFDGRWGGGL
jgi:hypothetical protein